MKSLELNVKYYEEVNLELLDLGIAPIQDYTIDKMTFYSINAISRDTEEEHKDYTCIFSNGDEFICIESYEVVRQKIQDNL